MDEIPLPLGRAPKDVFGAQDSPGRSGLLGEAEPDALVYVDERPDAWVFAYCQ